MANINTLTFQNGQKTGKSSSAVYIPNPSSYDVQMSDMDLNSKRSYSGYLNRNRVRQNVYSVSCTWDWLNEKQLYALLSACQASSFTLTFRDPLNLISSNGGYTTKTVYADANKNVKLVSTKDDTEDYWQISLKFIEL